MKRVRIISSVLVLGLLAAAAIALFRTPGLSEWLSNRQETVYIAVIGPMSGPDRLEGEAMLHGAELYLEHLRSAGDLPETRIELLPYDDRNDPQVAADLAATIADEDKILLVLGHSSSPQSIAAGKVYKQQEIPAITASALAEEITADTDWYFRTIPSNLVQGSFLAYYVKTSLKASSVVVIYENDAYGVSLLHNFERTARKLNLSILKQWEFSSEADDVDDRLETIINELRALEQQPDAIFLAAYGAEAAGLLTALRQLEQPYAIIGADDLATEWFLEELNADSRERQTSGASPVDGVFATTPFLPELAGERATAFMTDFERLYGKTPSWYEACYYDAMHIAVEAIKRAELQGSGYLYSDRKRLRNALTTFYDLEHAANGLTGPLYFTEQGDTVRPFRIGVYQQQRLRPAYRQYRTVAEPDQPETILRDTREGRLILVDGHFMKNMAVVYAGLHVLDICQLDVERSTYTVDFYLWFRFQEEFHDDQIEFLNSVGPVTLGEPVLEEVSEDLITRAYRVKAVFQDQFDFSRYPFDDHTLRLTFRHARLTSDDMIYAADSAGLPPALRDSAAMHSLPETLEKWRIGDISMSQGMFLKRATFGIPKFFSAPRTLHYSEMSAEIPLSRAGIGGFAWYAQSMGVVLMILLALLALLHRYLGLRVLLCLTALLINFYQHTRLHANLGIDSMTLWEWGILAVYGLILLILGLMIIHWRRYRVPALTADQEAAS